MADYLPDDSIIFVLLTKSIMCPLPHMKPLLKGQDVFLQTSWQPEPEANGWPLGKYDVGRSSVRSNSALLFSQKI